jgi:hypothetical protein
MWAVFSAFWNHASVFVMLLIHEAVSDTLRQHINYFL